MTYRDGRLCGQRSRAVPKLGPCHPSPRAAPELTVRCPSVRAVPYSPCRGPPVGAGWHESVPGPTDHAGSNSPCGVPIARAGLQQSVRAPIDIKLSRLAIDGFGAAKKGEVRGCFWNGPKRPLGAFWGIVAEVGRRLTWLVARLALLRQSEEPKKLWLNYSSSRCQIG